MIVSGYKILSACDHVTGSHAETKYSQDGHILQNI